MILPPWRLPRRLAVASVIASVCLVGSPLALAQDAVRLPLTSSLADLVEFVGDRLETSVEYNRSELTETVSLQIRDAVSDEELWEILTSVLEGRGFVVVEAQREKLYRVVRLDRAAAENQRLVLPEESPERDLSNFDSNVTRLETLSASEAANAIKPVLSPRGGEATAIGTSGLVLISDVRRRVEDALRLLEMLDSPRDEIERFIVELEHASASRLSDLLETIETARGAADAGAQRGQAGRSGGRGGGFIRTVPLPDDRRLLIFAPSSRAEGVRGLIETLDERESSETIAYSVPGVSPTELAESLSALIGTEEPGSSPGAAFSVRPDRLTSSVIVTAPGRVHERVRRFVEKLRDSPSAKRRVLRSFTIRNRDASELAETLESILSTGAVAVEAVDEARGGTPVGSDERPRPASTAYTDPDEPPSDRVALNVDGHTNTIVAVGDSSTIEQIASIVADLDRRQPQVMVEITLVSLSQGEALDLGVQLATEFEEGSTEFNLSSLFGLAVGGGGGGGAFGGTGFTGSIVNPGDYSVLIRAVEAINDGRTISVPKVLANNNATSSVRGVAREPFTSINASDTVATTSFGGTEDAGTTVTLTPQIAEGDHVVLEYSIELSAFTGQSVSTEGGGVVPPSSQQNSFEGEVTVPDGHVVVIGGLDDLADSESRNQIPLLGDLPLIGGLFGTTSESETRSRFYAFMHVTILRDAGFADLKSLSRDDLETAVVGGGHPALSPIWIE